MEPECSLFRLSAEHIRWSGKWSLACLPLGYLIGHNRISWIVPCSSALLDLYSCTSVILARGCYLQVTRSIPELPEQRCLRFNQRHGGAIWTN